MIFVATYAVADIHGNWKVWKAVKAFLKPGDTLYVLGDCADRGERGWDIIKEAINHPQVKYIKGNHEDMLASAIRGAHEDGAYGHGYYNLACNGGAVTYNDWACDGSREEWADVLDKLPLSCIYHNVDGKRIWLSHAGLTPLNQEVDFLWDREHIFDNWPEEGYENTYIIHGHTPCMYLAEDLNLEYEVDNPLWYCDGHKCCIDNLTVLHKAALLLNLDTFECHLIK